MTSQRENSIRRHIGKPSARGGAAGRPGKKKKSDQEELTGDGRQGTLAARFSATMGRIAMGGSVGEEPLRSSTRITGVMKDHELIEWRQAIDKKEAEGKYLGDELLRWMIETWKGEVSKDARKREEQPRRARGQSYSEQLKNAQLDGEYRGILREYYGKYRGRDGIPYAVMRVLAFIRRDRLQNEREAERVGKDVKLVTSPAFVRAGYECRRSERVGKARNQAVPGAGRR